LPSSCIMQWEIQWRVGPLWTVEAIMDVTEGLDYEYASWQVTSILLRIRLFEDLAFLLAACGLF
jgi:hypothetical protein